ncbi:centrosomal protein of 55 kDa [Megalops cyprinoides]|uniref:centrosomal protein of 55 kDa n=1 Tax=Megalops cyprinoides TaxID=118141 RepID=UPI00186509AB|nr:centrosomal protein of 55 kDa [Megalops cyprinoides]
MAAKNAKETIANKIGLKLTGSKAEIEVEKLKKENALLKKTLDEMANRKGKLTDSDKNKLLERILSLETLREKNSQQLLAKDQEIAKLRQQLRSEGGEIVASLQSQLDQKTKEAERREKLVQSLSEETKNVKNKLVAVSARCQELENRFGKQDPGVQSTKTDGQVPPTDVATIQEHLRDALEKNQQWLVYDQQREAYVKAVLARTLELEQQLNQANHALQQQHKEGNSEEEKSGQMQAHYDKLLLTAKKDLEWQKEQVAQARGEAADFRRKYEDKLNELEEVRQELHGERMSGRKCVEEERKSSAERGERLRAELESVDARLAEERKRSADLLLQVNLLQKSLLNQHEGQKRIAALEQQIQMSAKEFENEKLDRQSLQHQLQKVLKELRKAREQITKLESGKQPKESRFSEPTSYDRLQFERLSIDDPVLSHTSPSRIPNLLDESFLECPECRTQYPTSQHRELLAHIDYCMSASMK